MDAVYITLIVITACVAVWITYFAMKAKSKKLLSQITQEGSDAAVKVDKYKADIAALEVSIAELKEKYAKAIDGYSQKNGELSKQLEQVLNGNVDEAVREKLAKTDKLVKKIKDLEEEIEDNEDDIADLKKKLKNKTNENEDLQSKITESLRSVKELSEELEDTKATLDVKMIELGVKVESLTFVQEILLAKSASDDVTKRLNTKVDGIVEYITSDLHDALTETKTMSSDIEVHVNKNSPLLRGWEITSKKSWIKGKTTIALVGEFSAGKTSIVNRLLSQDNPNVPQLPVSTKATTAIPTYISGGVGTLYQFVTPSNELKTISENTFKRVNKEVLDQVGGVSSLIQYFVMKYQNSNLDNLSILDTPGFSSNDKEDAKRTIGVINECDALFWVFDVNNGTVNRTSINLIKEHLAKPLYVVINKVDTKAKSEVDKVENLIRKTLKDAGLNIEGYIRFSSKEPLESIMTPIKSIQHDKTKDEYLDAIENFIDNIVSELSRIVNEAQRDCNQCMNKSNNLVEQYDRAISNLYDDCENVASIPQFSEHWLRKDNYEMSQDEYSRMINLLNKIVDKRCGDLCSLYNQQMEVRGEIEEAWHIYEDARNRWQRMNECSEALSKKIKELRSNDR
jgi:hypothetical protein